MAHYAFLDENNIVTEVIVGKDENELINGKDPETWYGEFRGQVCKRTSYNTRGGIHYASKRASDALSVEPDGGIALRKNYAGIGYIYNSDRDAFIPPKPFVSWLLDEPTCTWEAPVPQPEGNYRWNEQTQIWDLVEDPLIY
jgi:hypothetical protein